MYWRRLINCIFPDCNRLVAIASILAAILAVGNLPDSDAWALSCTQLNDAEIDAAIREAYGRSDFVFVGIPVHLDVDYVPTDVEVETYWKGPNLATIPMNRSFMKSERRVIFAARSEVGGWRDSGPECVSISDAEMGKRLSRQFGSPAEPSPGNQEEYELLIVGSIFLLSGLLSIGVWVAIGRLKARTT